MLFSVYHTLRTQKRGWDISGKLARGTILNARRFFRVAAPSIRIVPWAALASCWPLPQQLLPVSATGGGRRRCSGKIIFICSFETPAEFGGAKPRHLLTQTTPLLESPTGAFIAAQPQPFRNYFFTGGVVEGNGSCRAAFCESAALRAGACSPSGDLSRSD